MCTRVYCVTYMYNSYRYSQVGTPGPSFTCQIVGCKCFSWCWSGGLWKRGRLGWRGRRGSAASDGLNGTRRKSSAKGTSQTNTSTRTTGLTEALSQNSIAFQTRLIFRWSPSSGAISHRYLSFKLRNTSPSILCSTTFSRISSAIVGISCLR